MGKSKNCLLMFRVPATAKGYEFITQMRNTLNKDSYKMRTLFTGKRPKGTTQATTLKKNAESIRVYIDSLIEDGTNPRINDIYENGITTGKAREQFANEELISELKHELDSKQNELKLEITGHTMMREERDELNKEVAELKTELTKRNSNYNAIYNSKVKEWNKTLSAKDDEIRRLNTKVDNEVCEGSCVSHEDYEDMLKDNIELRKEKETMRVEMIALSKSLAEVYQELIDLRKERSNAESKPVSRNNNDIDLDRIVDDTFDKWVAQKPWHKRWLYKIGSVSWRDFAFIMLAFWTIPMIVLLTLKVEGVIN